MSMNSLNISKNLLPTLKLLVAFTLAQNKLGASGLYHKITSYLLLEALFIFVKATLWCFIPSFKSLYASLESET